MPVARLWHSACCKNHRSPAGRNIRTKRKSGVAFRSTRVERATRRDWRVQEEWKCRCRLPLVAPIARSERRLWGRSKWRCSERLRRSGSRLEPRSREGENCCVVIVAVDKEVVVVVVVRLGVATVVARSVAVDGEVFVVVRLGVATVVARSVAGVVAVVEMAILVAVVRNAAARRAANFVVACRRLFFADVVVVVVVVVAICLALAKLLVAFEALLVPVVHHLVVVVVVAVAAVDGVVDHPVVVPGRRHSERCRSIKYQRLRRAPKSARRRSPHPAAAAVAAAADDDDPDGGDDDDDEHADDGGQDEGRFRPDGTWRPGRRPWRECRSTGDRCSWKPNRGR